MGVSALHPPHHCSSECRNLGLGTSLFSQSPRCPWRQSPQTTDHCPCSLSRPRPHSHSHALSSIRSRSRLPAPAVAFPLQNPVLQGRSWQAPNLLAPLLPEGWAWRGISAEGRQEAGKASSPERPGPAPRSACSPLGRARPPESDELLLPLPSSLLARDVTHVSSSPVCSAR